MVKGPKVLNPADRARKEARKKELKKNKKQRQQVRSAVIESKDPEKIIADLEKLDELEFDVNRGSSSTSDTFFKDKRKRLKDSWARILLYYQKEDPEKYSKLKKLESEYEIKHKATEKNFDAVKAAQEVKIEDVFLPPEPDADTKNDEVADDDPLMSESVYITPLTGGMKPPGCPPGLPPDFKQLVESLKSSLAAPIPQTLPQNLLNLALPKNNFDRPHNKGPPRDGKDFKRARPPKARQAAPSNRDPKDVATSKPTKAAVIESKPVIFMPKATKFVPASVRSKIGRLDDKRSA